MVQPTIQVPHRFVSTPNSGNPNEPPLSRSILQWTFALPGLNGIPTAILPFDRLMMGSHSGVHGTSLHIRTLWTNGQPAYEDVISIDSASSGFDDQDDVPMPFLGLLISVPLTIRFPVLESIPCLMYPSNTWQSTWLNHCSPPLATQRAGLIGVQFKQCRGSLLFR